MNFSPINVAVMNGISGAVLTQVPMFFDTLHLSPAPITMVSAESRYVEVMAQEPIIVTDTHDEIISS